MFAGNGNVVDYRTEYSCSNFGYPNSEELQTRRGSSRLLIFLVASLARVPNNAESRPTSHPCMRGAWVAKDARHSLPPAQPHIPT